MNKNAVKKVFIGIFIVILSSLSLFSILNGDILTSEFISKPNQPENNLQSRILNFEKLEIADESKEIEKGMMYRQEEDLCSDCGILFVFEDEAKRSFWMKNCYFSLDMIFLSEQGEILNIAENTKPDQTEELYYSKGNAKYVLEVKAGYSDQKSLKEGQFLDVQYLLDQGVEYNNEF